jgi:hypothetical protein
MNDKCIIARMAKSKKRSSGPVKAQRGGKCRNARANFQRQLRRTGSLNIASPMIILITGVAEGAAISGCAAAVVSYAHRCAEFQSRDPDARKL